MNIYMAVSPGSFWNVFLEETVLWLVLPSVIKQQSKFPEPTGDWESRALSSVSMLAAICLCSNQVVGGILNVWGPLPMAVHFLLWKVTPIDVFGFAFTDLAIYVWWVCLVGGGVEEGYIWGLCQMIKYERISKSSYRKVGAKMGFEFYLLLLFLTISWTCVIIALVRRHKSMR